MSKNKAVDYTQYVHEFVDAKGDTRYGVAEWNDETGQYTRPMAHRDYILTGCSAEFGNARIFSEGYWGGYRNRSHALRRARYLFGTMEGTMDKEVYTISFSSSGIVWRKNHTSVRGAKQCATRGMTHGCGDVSVECPNGGVWVRRFWQSLNRFGWEDWEQVN